jgi:hypothetical protein
LWALPRFDPFTVVEIIDNDVNNIGAVMGAKMERPIGNKAVKKKLDDERSRSSYALSQSRDMGQMARATQQLARTAAQRLAHDADMDMAKLHLALGKDTQMCLYMASIATRRAQVKQNLEATACAPSAASSRCASIDEDVGNLPLVINTQKIAEEKNNEDDDEHVSTTSSGHAKTARYKRLPSGLSSNEDDDTPVQGVAV